MHNISRIYLSLLIGLAVIVVCWRALVAIGDLVAGDETAFLAFPLTVILPACAFAFLAVQQNMTSQEGALMQLGVMIQIVLILALPGLALYLALGFPVVFLVVELFETRAPAPLRHAIKSRVLR